MPLVVVTGLNGDVGPHWELLKKAGFEARVASREVDLFQAETLIPEIKDAAAIIAGSEPYSAETLAKLPKLRAIVRMGVGFDAIDVPECDKLKIVVATTPGVNHHAVAEHTIALLMAVARGFPARDQFVRKGTWKRFGTPRIAGRTIGLVGLGRIGQATATRAIGLGMKVIAYDPFPNKDFAAEHKIELVSFDELIARSNYVSLHLPMSKENYHIINAQTIAKMQPGTIVINTARGPLIDEKALYDALKSGHLAGAGLDVFEIEPLPLTSPLLKLDNVLLCGHLAGLDFESQHDTLKMCAEIIISLRDGGWPKQCIQNLVGVTDWKW
jgi:phosphoglycerate dehydrogenase-like enzyme